MMLLRDCVGVVRCLLFLIALMIHDMYNRYSRGGGCMHWESGRWSNAFENQND